MSRKTQDQRSTRTGGDSVPTQQHEPTRRGFIKGSGLVLAGHAISGNQAALARTAHAYGSDAIKVALIGCGYQGLVTTRELFRSSVGGIQLVALADAFSSQLQAAYRTLKGRHREAVQVQERRFDGLLGYRSIMQTDCDLVVIATPPAFHPMLFSAAIDAGKHVYLEMPVAVDASGIHRITETGQRARARGLAVGVGLPRRSDPNYQECIARLRDGAIGDPVLAKAFWNSGSCGTDARRATQSELEYQIRNWQQFTWLGGDVIAEQHAQNLDVVNWVMESSPIMAQGQGARIDDAMRGSAFDQHMIEFRYGNGVELLSQCRRQRGCWNQIAEHLVGTRGSADISAGRIIDRRGDVVWQSESRLARANQLQRHLADFIDAMRAGYQVSQLDAAIESSMTAILGRVASYSGKLAKWDAVLRTRFSVAKPDELLSVSDQAPVLPNASGSYPIAVPGSRSC